ncbi:unnamed protein product [Cladocopium goreaui]|uniref:Uncharacterized protein n=1 Tax=Cladocopium goreaui TaxID=2562237 RepID=A0A9P1GDF1_9DINO|nr:unnamed protein product [Cladocopium goreaui]
MDPEGADANAKGCPVGGIHVEWERADAVRNHLREEGAVLFAEGVAESVKNAVKPHIHAYLIPLLTRMAEHDSRPQPLVDPLRDELSLLYKNISKQCDETTIVHDSWLTRKFLGMIKMKDRAFQELCLILNPMLQDLCDEINRKTEEKKARHSKDSLEDHDDDYDDSPEAMEANEGSPEQREEEPTPEVLQSQLLEIPDSQVPPPALPAASPVPAEVEVSSAPPAAAAVDGSDQGQEGKPGNKGSQHTLYYDRADPVAKEPEACPAEPASAAQAEPAEEVDVGRGMEEEDAEDEFVTRNDQLTAKHQKKADNKAGKGKGRGRGRSRGKGEGKKRKGGKAKNTDEEGYSTKKTKETKVRKSRKRNMLSAGSSPGPSTSKKSKRNDAKSQDSQVPKATPKGKAKTAKAKAEAKSKSKPAPKKGREAGAKSKASPKAKAKGKAKAQPRSRSKKTGPHLMESALHDDSLVKSLMDHARQFGPELEHDTAALKEAVKAVRVQLEWAKLMPYWNRGDCGLKVWDEETESFKGRDTFSFHGSSAPNRYKLAVAVRCAEIAAEGIDAMAEGFEKDGEQIRILKHNAQLALFFFANGMGEDEPFQDSDENGGKSCEKVVVVVGSLINPYMPCALRLVVDAQPVQKRFPSEIQVCQVMAAIILCVLWTSTFDHAEASFDALPDAGFDLGYARLWEAYGYIRRGKHLAIPAEWKELCATFKEGVDQVASSAEQLEAEERELEQQIEEMMKLKHADMSSIGAAPEQAPADSKPGGDCTPSVLEVAASPTAETQATADELQAMREQSTAPPPLDDGTTDELPSAKVDKQSMAPPAPKREKLKTRQEKLREAAKARLRRMMQHHKTKVAYNVPEWVKEEFICQLEIVVTKKKAMTIRVDEIWASEKEMKEDLKWSPARIAGAKKDCEAKGATHCRKNMYDNVDEYYVIVKETGSREEQATQEEIQRKIGKASDTPKIDDDGFAGIDARQAQVDASKAAAARPQGTPQLAQEMEVYVATLEAALKNLDEQYDKCHAAFSNGEVHAFKGECSKACAAEMKIRNAKKYEKRDEKPKEDEGPRKPRRRRGEQKVEPVEVPGKLFASLLETLAKVNRAAEMFELAETASIRATSCAAAIRQARGVVADIGEEAAKKSPGLPELARCQQSTSERDVRRVVVKYHLSVPIPLTQLRKTPGTMYQGEINVLSLKDWITYIVQNNVWHLLVGLMKADAIRERKILVEFWRRYRQLRPTHPIFEMSDAGKVDLSRCAPCVVHGDEGRGRKKTGFLVISYYSYIGFGTSQANQARKNKEYLRMRLNYGGSSLLHRLLTAVLPKMLKDDVALNDILQFIGEDARGMLLEGVKNAQGDTFRACILQCCGHWQWLIKAGHLVRSYLNVEKRPKKEGANPKGVCHLCAAGQTGVFWERYRGLRQPLWFPTMLSQDPFGSQSGLNRIPFLPNQQPLFYTFDLFHSWHLGVGKSLVAGCLAMASEYMWASNVDDRLEQLSGLFMTWCAENHEWAFLNSLTRPVLGWMDKGQYPNGYWSKGHTTTTLCTFFESWARHQDFSGDTLMQLSVETCQKMSKAMRIMYESDVFLPRHAAGEVAALGLMTMEWYKKIATQAFREGKALFPHMPKGHSIDHIFHQLQMDVESGAEFCLNPLNHSVQVSEDFVGRNAAKQMKHGTSGLTATLANMVAAKRTAALDHWRARMRDMQCAARWVRHSDLPSPCFLNSDGSPAMNPKEQGHAISRERMPRWTESPEAALPAQLNQAQVFAASLASEACHSPVPGHKSGWCASPKKTEVPAQCRVTSIELTARFSNLDQEAAMQGGFISGFLFRSVKLPVDLLQLRFLRARHVQARDVLRAAERDAKRLFHVDLDHGRISANQGHSSALAEVLSDEAFLAPIERAEELPVCISSCTCPHQVLRVRCTVEAGAI